MLTATFRSLGRDLYWTFHDAQDGTIRWVGYDDTNWWQNVASNSRVRKGAVTGRSFSIDFETNTVEVMP